MYALQNWFPLWSISQSTSILLQLYESENYTCKPSTEKPRVWMLPKIDQNKHTYMMQSMTHTLLADTLTFTNRLIRTTNCPHVHLRACVCSYMVSKKHFCVSALWLGAGWAVVSLLSLMVETYMPVRTDFNAFILIIQVSPGDTKAILSTLWRTCFLLLFYCPPHHPQIFRGS